MSLFGPDPEATPAFAADPVLAALQLTPFTVVGPVHKPAPFIFASPHSGSEYPLSFIAASRLDAMDLRRSEDAYVDQLFEAAPAYGATLIKVHFPRAYVDVNRAERELDPHMFDGSIEPLPSQRTVRVAAGLGVIPRVVKEGVEIYRRRVLASEADFRLAHFYRPYHFRLAQLLNEARAQFGAAILIDCHSMPPLARGHDIVIGDCHGEAAGAELTEFVETALKGLGFRVGRNSPYAGGYTTSLHGRPLAGFHALQLEINRGLYMDEKRIEKTKGFADCQVLFTRFVAALINAPAIVARSDETARFAAQ